jgi:hypothetical protein
MQENTLVKAKTIVRVKADVRPETTAAKARTLAKARAVARLRIAAVRARMGAKPAKAFNYIAFPAGSVGKRWAGNCPGKAVSRKAESSAPSQWLVH